jgi:hypothetical protein
VVATETDGKIVAVAASGVHIAAVEVEPSVVAVADELADVAVDKQQLEPAAHESPDLVGHGVLDNHKSHSQQQCN